MKYKKFTIDNYSQFRRLLEDTEGVSNRKADSYEGIERYLLRNPGFSFSAFESNSMVACVLCGHDGRRGYLQHVMVKPDYRRKGIASELIKCCLDELMKIGIMKTHIDVFKKNDLANSYWHKNGWELREDYLLPLSITIKDMSGNLGVSRKTLSKIINERGAITPD